MKKIICFVLINLILICLIGCLKTGVTLVYGPNFTGVISNKETITVDNKSVTTHKTVGKEIILFFEGESIETKFNNTIKIGDYFFAIPYKTPSGFSEYKISFPGILCIDGKIDITFNIGCNSFNVFDAYKIRNPYLKIGNDEIWSNEYSKEDYINTQFKLGQNQKDTDLRFGYLKSLGMTFSINSKYLDSYGHIFSDYKQSYLIDKQNYINYNYIDTTINFSNNATITKPTKIINEHSYVSMYFNGIPIKQDFIIGNSFVESYNNTLVIDYYNPHGSSVTSTINFNVLGQDIENFASLVDAYDQGVNPQYPSQGNMGKKITSNLKVDFKEKPNILMKFETKTGRDVLFEITKLPNHVPYILAFNYQTLFYETIAVGNTNSTSIGTKLNDAYIKDDEALLILETKNTATEWVFDKQIVHITDTQYLTQLISKNQDPLKSQAALAYTTYIDYLSYLQDNSTLSYLAMTGDMVQTFTNRNTEYSTVNNYFITPLLSTGIPFGLTTGNHDVGGTSDNPYGSSGVNNLDDSLKYDLFDTFFGETAFSSQSYYGGCSIDSRVRYDYVKIGNQDFMFLYLGWGSQKLGDHVSSNDINYAKGILSSNMDKEVVLLIHDYLTALGVKTQTGNLIFNSLVKPYKNIKFVLCGHTNGISTQLDYIDDDNDGISDRAVLQLLTNFQEEENLFGASFCRLLKFDFTNSRIYLDVYSPYLNDYEVNLTTNAYTFYTHRNGVFYYNINKVEFGLTIDKVNA